MKINKYNKPKDANTVITGNFSSNRTYSNGSTNSATTAEKAGTADKLTNSRLIWGQPFDGTADVDGDMTLHGDIYVETYKDPETDEELGGNVYAKNLKADTGNITTVNSTTVNATDVNVSNKVTSKYVEATTEIKTPLITATNGNIDTVKSKLVDTEKLNVSISAFIKELLATDITCDNLTVTKAAHFFKLVIDEIKATKGQVIVTAGNATIDLVETISGGYRCYFRSKDADGREITPSFEKNDQVICQTFNAATGTSYNVSNTYYWRLCTGVSSSVVTKKINGQDVDCWYIDLSDSDKDSYTTTAPKAGDEVVQLGNRSDTSRQSAIIISAYNNTYLDPELKSPSIVQYDGIKTYELKPYRVNVISKGYNIFKGTFTATNGKDIEDLIDDVDKKADEYTDTYLHLAWANSADGSTDFTKTNNGGDYLYIGMKSDFNESDDTLTYKDYKWSRLKGNTGTSVTITSKSVTYQVSDSGTTVPTGTWKTTVPSTSAGQYLWTKTYVKYSDGTETTSYSVSYFSTNGNDAEYYTISPVIEKAIVDKNGTLGVQFQYNIIHVKGNSTETVTASKSGYWVRVKPDNSSTYYDCSVNTTSPTYTNTSFLTNYHKATSRPIYFTAYLVYGSSATVKDRSTIPVVFDAAATLTITDNITSTVQGYKNDLDTLGGTVSNHTNSISTIQQNYDSIKSTVSSHTTKLNNLSVGATNMLRETKLLDETYCNLEGTKTVKGKDEFTTIYKAYVSNSGGYNDVLSWNSKLELETNTYYTLSFFAKGSGKLTNYLYHGGGGCCASGSNSYGNRTTNLDGRIDLYLTSSWKRYWVTWKTSSTASNLTGMQSVIIGRLSASGSYVYLAAPKFEKGNTPTDWSPHPEDAEAKITSLSSSVSSIEQTANSISSRVTTIENNYVSESEITQLSDNIQLNVYDNLKNKTGIDVSNGSITLNANTTTVVGNLNLTDTYNGLTVYDSDSIPRINLQPTNISGYESIVIGTYDWKATSTITCNSTSNTFSKISLGYFSNKALQISNIFINSSNTSAYISNLTINVYLGNTKVGTKTLYNFGVTQGGYKQASNSHGNFGLFDLKGSGYLYVEYVLNMSSSTSATVFINAKYQIGERTLTYMGKNGMFSQQLPNQYLWLDTIYGFELRKEFTGLRIGTSGNTSGYYQDGLEVIAGVSGSTPNVKPLWISMYNFEPVWGIGSSTQRVWKKRSNGNLSETDKYCYVIQPARDRGICYVNSPAFDDSNNQVNDNWILLPNPNSISDSSGNSGALPVGYKMTIINATGKNVYVTANTSYHQTKFRDANRNENWYCELNGTQSRDTYIYMGSLNGYYWWETFHDTQ